MKILIATTNAGKLAELSAMLDEDIQWQSLKDFSDIAEVAEDGNSFAENAQKKALGYAKQTHQWTIADDSGLVIDALGGEPGVMSARYSGKKTADRGLLDYENMRKVLERLQGVETHRRTARFVCNICLADEDKILAQAEGVLEGLIAESPAGENGFGYDPIFYLPQFKKTVAQLEPTEKNTVSHRYQATVRLKLLLSDLLKTHPHQ